MAIADERMALAPIAEALPELAAEDYADVREWHAARVTIGESYELEDGAYLAKIQAKLAPLGLWGAYLDACGLARQTAQDRILKAQGRFQSYRAATESVVPGLLSMPSSQPNSDPKDGGEWDEHEWDDIGDDSDLPEPEPMPVPPAPTPAPVTRAAPAMFTSNSDRWFTPPDLLAKIDAFLGGIELDPCPATGEGEDIAQDGLAIPWHGRVFCNPPYNRAVAAWIAKALGEPGITEAVFLVAARTDTDWWQAAVRGWADAVCFIDGRLRFSGSANSAPFPSALLYHGPHVGQFLSAFQHLGWTITRGGPWGSSQGEADEEDEG